MNKSLRVVWSGPLAAWLVATSSVVSLPSWANCVAAGNAITCAPAGGNQTATVGTGGTTPSGTTVDVTTGSLVTTGNASGVSLGDNATITVRSGATVQNFSTGADSPYGGGIGANVIEFNNNSTLIVEQGASVLANGTATDSEAVNTVGGNNTIINRGLIRSTNAAIFSQANVAQNFIVNSGTIEAGFQSGVTNGGLASVLGQNGVTAVDFTNRGAVIGSLNFGNLNDTLRVYTGSSVTGDINGGAGTNVLTLNSDTGAAATFSPLSLGGFQSLVTNGGVWTFTPSLAGSGITSTTVAGGTLILGADASAYAGALSVQPGGTLQSTAAFAPTTIPNAGLVRFAQPTNASYTGLVTGTGGIEKTGAGVLTLTQNQPFTGLTTITAGTLQLGNGGTTGGVLGNIVDNATLAINRSNLLTIAGQISGVGNVNQIGTGTTVFTADNTYTGGTTIAAGTLQLGAGGTQGGIVGNVVNNATLIVNRSNTFALTGNVSGTGRLQQLGSGTTVLSGANTYSGATTVSAGTLRAGAANTFSAASAHTVAAGATLDLAGFNQTVASLANSGTVSLVGTAPGTTLTVTGPYVGNNGVLRLGTFLGDSSSASDRLVLSGSTAIASGSTQIAITQLGGLGALTTGNGIQVVSAINGASTAANAFTLAGGHVDAGAYEYRLYDGDASGAGENWYLRSTSNLPTVPTLPPVVVPTYRAEVPLYAALPEQLRQMDLAMLGNLHLRIGDDDVRTGPAVGGDRRAWGRVISRDLDIRQTGTVSPSSDGRMNGFQAGTDLIATPNWRAGVYVGQLDGDARVAGFASGIANLNVGRSDLRNQYLGAYATWTNGTGFYADGVLQASRYRYDVTTSVFPRSGGRGDGLLGSIEIGQSFKVSENWSVEPQLQLVHQHMNLDDVDIFGARVSQSPDSSLMLRAGVRVKGQMSTGAGLFQPYARLNVYRTSNGADVARFIGPAGVTAISTQVGGTSTELAAGGTLALSPATSLYGELGKLWASGGDARVRSSLQASLGVRVRW